MSRIVVGSFLESRLQALFTRMKGFEPEAHAPSAKQTADRSAQKPLLCCLLSLKIPDLKVGAMAFLVICCSTPCLSGEGLSLHGQAQTDPVLTGNIRVDLFSRLESISGPTPQDLTIDPSASTHKSPWLAAGLSLLVPGAGEFYAESYWKAAAFFALEVAAWTIAYSNDKQGDDQTTFFQGFADDHWSAARYAQWTIANAGGIKAGIDVTQYQEGGSQSVIDIEENVNWTNLNALERELGMWYSHTLPLYGEQQYFELIGKYQQFYQGWDDADPTLTTYDAIAARLTSGGTRFNYYSVERGKANDFYSTASTAVTIALVNHVVSAIDGAWSASLANSNFQARVGMQRVPRGVSYSSVPSLKLSYRL